MSNTNEEASEKPAGAPPLAVEESRALRQQRQQARFRNRGGIFVPQEKNTLLDLLMARTVTGESPPRRARSRSLSPSKSARTGTSGKVKTVNRRGSSIRPSEKAVKARRKSVAARIAELQDEGDKDGTQEEVETPVPIVEPKAGSSQKPLKSQGKKKSSKKSAANKPSKDGQEPKVVEIETKTSKSTQKVNVKPKKQAKSAAENGESNKTTEDAQPKESSKSKKKSKQAAVVIERSEHVLASDRASSPEVPLVTKVKGKSKAKPKKESKQKAKEKIIPQAEDEVPLAEKIPPEMSKKAKDNAQADAVDSTTKSSHKRLAYEVDIEKDGDSSPLKPQKRVKQSVVEKSKGIVTSDRLNLTADPKVPVRPLKAVPVVDEAIGNYEPADVLETSANDKLAKAKSGGSGKKHGKKAVPLSEKDAITKNAGPALKKRNREDNDDNDGSKEDDEVMKPAKKKSKAGATFVVADGDQASPKPKPKPKSRRQKENAIKPGLDSKSSSKKKQASESSKKPSQKTVSQRSKKTKVSVSAPTAGCNVDTQPAIPPTNISDNRKNSLKAEPAFGRAVTVQPTGKIKKGLPTPIRKRVHVAGWASPLASALVPPDDEPDPIDFLS